MKFVGTTFPTLTTGKIPLGMQQNTSELTISSMPLLWLVLKFQQGFLSFHHLRSDYLLLFLPLALTKTVLDLEEHWSVHNFSCQETILSGSTENIRHRKVSFFLLLVQLHVHCKNYVWLKQREKEWQCSQVATSPPFGKILICKMVIHHTAGGLGRTPISKSPYLLGHMDSVLGDLPSQKREFKQGESSNLWATT